MSIVVTGIGVVSPLGVGLDDTFDSLVGGGSGAGPITLFDASEHKVQHACEATDFRPEDFLSTKDLRRTDRFVHLAIAAAQLAVADAGINPRGDRVGVACASAAGGGMTREEQMRVLVERGPSRISPYAFTGFYGNMGAGQVSMHLGSTGPVFAPAHACAASVDAIGLAAMALRRGDADIMIAGGTDVMITPLWIAGFDAMRVLTHPTGDPADAPKPFAPDRDGFLVGEAAVLLVLEREEDARSRGARARGTILGYGASNDAFHMTDPEPSSRPKQLSIEAALADGAVVPERVGYVSAHGGASLPGDTNEVLALRGVFADHAKDIVVGATKSATGHTMGAAGALATALTLRGMERGLMPGTRNLRVVDPECTGVDHITGPARAMEVDVALVCASGLGGHNACLALSHPDAA